MQRNRRRPEKYLKIHIFNTFFLGHHQRNGYKIGKGGLARWTKKVMKIQQGKEAGSL
jgi:hypothetical protein